MQRGRSLLILGVVAGVTALFAVACSENSPNPVSPTEVATNAFAASIARPESRNFVAPLSGGEEVLSVDTKATGLAKFQVNKDGDEISYKLIVANIENVRFAHIHMAPEGQNGPIVVTLFPGPTTDGRTNGTIAQGTITASDVVGPLAGDLDALIDRMTIGRAYVNVHTDANPPGEIRGQIAEAGPSR